MLDPRGRLLLATVSAARLPLTVDMPVVQALHGWLDSWRGLGAIEGGMFRQGYDLQLTRLGEDGWSARFEGGGREHSLTSVVGTASGSTPWQAVQEAARRTLERVVQEEQRASATPRGGPAEYLAAKRARGGDATSAGAAP